MDQLTFHQALYLPILDGAKAMSAPAPSARLAMLANPAARNVRFSRAAAALTQAGQRLALAARRVGQPADTFTGPMPGAPEDIRVRYMTGVFGSTESPPSPRDASRRW